MNISQIYLNWGKEMFYFEVIFITNDILEFCLFAFHPQLPKLYGVFGCSVCNGVNDSTQYRLTISVTFRSSLIKVCTVHQYFMSGL